MSGSKRHPLFARMYASTRGQEPEAQLACRRELLAGIGGRVLELGAGDGRNFSFYPSGVEDVVAVEPEPYLRRRAQERADSGRLPFQVVDAVAEALPLPDASFDAAIASLVLCSVTDQSRSLAELCRVVRPGGELRFFEHVQADGGALRVFITVMDRSTIYPRLAGGCHPARDTLGAIRTAGFEIVTCRSFGLKLGALQPRIPYILGSARRPAD